MSGAVFIRKVYSPEEAQASSEQDEEERGEEEEEEKEGNEDEEDKEEEEPPPDEFAEDLVSQVVSLENLYSESSLLLLRERWMNCSILLQILLNV